MATRKIFRRNNPVIPLFHIEEMDVLDNFRHPNFFLFFLFSDLKHCALIFFPAYIKPHVLAYSERAIDVFDSTNGVWIQTVQIPKVSETNEVSILHQLTKQYHDMKSEHVRSTANLERPDGNH